MKPPAGPVVWKEREQTAPEAVREREREWSRKRVRECQRAREWCPQQSCKPPACGQAQHANAKREATTARRNSRIADRKESGSDDGKMGDVAAVVACRGIQHSRQHGPSKHTTGGTRNDARKVATHRERRSQNATEPPDRCCENRTKQTSWSASLRSARRQGKHRASVCKLERGGGWVRHVVCGKGGIVKHTSLTCTASRTAGVL